MKYITEKVTSRCGRKGGPKQVVGEPRIEQFETVGEAVQTLGSEDELLKYVNAQHATNVKNEVRRQANVTVSDATLRKRAIDEVLADNDALGELLSISDPNAREAKKDELIAARVEVLREAQEATKPAAGECAVTGDEDEDEGE